MVKKQGHSPGNLVQRAREARARKILVVLNRIYPKRRSTTLHHTSPWELLVATILSAQCTDKRVNEVTKTLFKKYRKLEDYTCAIPTEFEQDIRSTGFYRNKAKNILATAKKIEQEYDGKIPEVIEDLLTLPGVARKTAVVVLSNAFGHRGAGIAVDTHVKRFVTRFDLSDHRDPVRIEQDLMKLLPPKDWFDFHSKIIYYGREICPARSHDCESHPLTKVYPPAAKIWPKAK